MATMRSKLYDDGGAFVNEVNAGVAFPDVILFQGVTYKYGAPIEGDEGAVRYDQAVVFAATDDDILTPT